MNKQEQSISDKNFYDGVGHTDFDDLPIDYLQSQIIKMEKEIEDLQFAIIGFQGVIDERSELNGN